MEALEPAALRWMRAGGWPRLGALAVVTLWSVLAGAYYFNHDAITYLAAGERLNDGGELYQLRAGDRVVETALPYFGPLLSPPLIAVVWRPLALFGEPGAVVWTLALGGAVLVTIAHVAVSWRMLALVIAVSIGAGFAVISGNVSNLFLPAYVAIWRFRNRPWIGLLIAAMAVAKILPATFVAFLLSGRNLGAVRWFGVSLVAFTSLSIVGAGWQNSMEYLSVAINAEPQPSSVAYLTGVRWLSPLMLAIGVVLAAVVSPRWSFALCVISIVVGAPVLSWRETAALIAAPVPWLTRLSGGDAETGRDQKSSGTVARHATRGASRISQAHLAILRADGSRKLARLGTRLSRRP